MEKLIEQYEQALQNHDWDHAMSDSYRQHQKGKEQQKEIRKLFNQIDKKDEAIRIWNKYCPTHLAIPTNITDDHRYKISVLMARLTEAYKGKDSQERVMERKLRMEEIKSICYAIETSMAYNEGLIDSFTYVERLSKLELSYLKL